MIDKLNDLNDLIHGGINKNWIYKDEFNDDLAGDYLQKIEFSISDYNKELSIRKKEPKDIVFMIMLANWIKDTIDLLFKTYKKGIVEGFQYKSLSNEKAYLEAIRSFVVAHPMKTDRHKKFSLDGRFICNDIMIEDRYLMPFMKEDSIFTITIDGLIEGKGVYDYLLKVYSIDDNMKYFKYICCSIDDISKCISSYIEMLYAFSKYLGKLKLKDYKEGIKNE